jgi:hypothetical protein
MPTIDRYQGLRVVIYPNDHRPPHVHVIGRGCEAVFRLNCPSGPLELRNVLHFDDQEITRLAAWLASRIHHACLGWSRIHGHH